MALPRGATIGMLGGGQIGRMTAQAAARLGFRTHVYTPEAGGPASQVTDRATVAPWDDEAALERFAAAVDVVTLEFENVPVETLRWLAERVPVFPSPQVLETSQDRIREKRFAADAGAATAPWREVRGVEELRAAIDALGAPAILKQTRFGYDGKGQVRIDPGADLEAAWDAVGHHICVLEGFVDFACEVSVVVGRTADGDVVTHPVVENDHEAGILRESRCPASIDQAIARRAEEVATRLAAALDLRGLITVEFFVTADGDVLVNEMAPRPHNSGHWTIEGAATSQFEQLVRICAGLPLGSTELLHRVRMRNLLGDEITDVDALLRDGRARLHDYGKADVRPGRKMGHVTFLEPL